LFWVAVHVVGLTLALIIVAGVILTDGWQQGLTVLGVILAADLVFLMLTPQGRSSMKTLKRLFQQR
jgi:hypothetical protein